MEKDKKWKKPEINILFSGKVNKDVMVTTPESGTIPDDGYNPNDQT